MHFSVFIMIYLLHNPAGYNKFNVGKMLSRALIRLNRSKHTSVFDSIQNTSFNRRITFPLEVLYILVFNY